MEFSVFFLSRLFRLMLKLEVSIILTMRFLLFLLLFLMYLPAQEIEQVPGEVEEVETKPIRESSPVLKKEKKNDKKSRGITKKVKKSAPGKTDVPNEARSESEKVNIIDEQKVYEKDQQRVRVINKKEPIIDNRNFVGEIGYLVSSIKASLSARLARKKYKYLRQGIPIIGFDSTPNLVYAHQNAVINKLKLIKTREFYFVESFETLNFKTKVREGKITVTKGVQSKEELQEILDKYDSRYYATIYLELLNKRHLRLTVRFIDNETGDPILILSSTVRVGLKDDQIFSVMIGQDRYTSNLAAAASTLRTYFFYGERLYGVGEIAIFPSVGALFENNNFQALDIDFGAQFLFNLNELFRGGSSVSFFLGAMVMYRVKLYEAGGFNPGGDLLYAGVFNVLIENISVGLTVRPRQFGQFGPDVLGVYIGFTP